MQCKGPGDTKLTRFSKADAVLTDVMQMRQAFAQREKDDTESKEERERGVY